MQMNVQVNNVIFSDAGGKFFEGKFCGGIKKNLFPLFTFTFPCIKLTLKDKRKLTRTLVSFFIASSITEACKNLN